jgi:protoporphyrin/coproporphyrin ferrochelatase
VTDAPADFRFPHDCPADGPDPATGARPTGVDRSRQAVLLMAYGSVDSLDQVPAYYTHIRRGSPPPPALLEELLDRYRAIGGSSPLSGHTERQRAAVQAELARRGLDVAVHVGMKHIAPFIAERVRGIAGDGTTHLVAMALAPHFSTMSICAYCHAVDEGRSGLDRSLTFEMVRSWHAEPRFIAALSAATREAIERLPGASPAEVVFTAHSLPEKILERGDPYRDLLLATAGLVAGELGLPTARWSFAFQSAGRTADPWLGPDLGDHLRSLAAAGSREVVVCPVGFVSDHLEVLYDVDIEAQGVARELGIQLRRARSMNDDPTFIGAVADVLERALARERVPA